MWKIWRKNSDKIRQNHLFTIVRVSCRMATGIDEERKCSIWQAEWSFLCLPLKHQKVQPERIFAPAVFLL